MSNINPPPLNGNIADVVGRLTGGWVQWFSQIFYVCFDVQNSGTTAQRPVTRLYPGKPYFDTSLGALGKKIFVDKNATGWVDGTGAPV